MNHPSHYMQMISALRRRPDAMAAVHGSRDCPKIDGQVNFYQTNCGVLVAADLHGLPKTETSIFAFHIHSGDSCTGNREDPFSDADGHFNPRGCAHPCHAGDLPPLFGNDGCAFLVFLTGRFRVQDIIGRTVIIHSHPDDFTTQPSGGAGTKIACGEIKCCRC